MAEGVRLPEDLQRRLNVWKAGAGLAICALYGWFAFVKDAQVPVLVFLDVAIHEIGHRLFSPFGAMTMLVMGTGTQILFPFLVGIVFAIWRRDLVAWGIAWAWAASAMADGARYIYDAPRGELMLLGASDGLGDWSKILGPEHVDKLYLADRLAAIVRAAGVITWLAAIVIIAFAIVWNVRGVHRAARAETPQPTATPSGTLAPVSDMEMWRR